jgi:two-component system, response regulator PdtaR
MDGQPTILVVEDEMLIRVMGVENLADAGFHVLEAGNADEAVAVLEQADSVQLMFTDINMPGSMDGFALAELVHRRWPDIRLLLTSGNERPQVNDLPDEGRFVPKPYRFDHIVREIKDLVGLDEKPAVAGCD